mgnify:CR=1 FL=1|jgi:hypothetical protein
MATHPVGIGLDFIGVVHDGLVDLTIDSAGIDLGFFNFLQNLFPRSDSRSVCRHIFNTVDIL